MVPNATTNNLRSIYFKYEELIRFSLSFFLAILFSIVFNDILSLRNWLADSELTALLLNITGNTTLFFLEIFRFEYFVEGIKIKLENTNGVLIVFGCLAYRHIILFIAFILFYSGKFHHKLWYIFLGTISLIIINSFRIFIIAISQIQFSAYTEEIHFYFTRLIMYGTLFLFWFIWIKRVQYK